MPPAVVARASAEVMAVLASKEVADRIRAAGAVPVGGSPAQAQAVLDTERARWKAVIQAANISID